MRLSKYLAPNTFVSWMQGNQLFYLPGDLAYPSESFLAKKVVMTARIITPYRLKFGMTTAGVAKAIGKPFLVVSDDQHIKQHEIWLYKRMVGGYRSTSQLHFFDGQLRIVFEEIKKVYRHGDMQYPSVLKAFGYELVASGPCDPHCTILKDEKQSLLIIDEGVNVTLRFQQK